MKIKKSKNLIGAPIEFQSQIPPRLPTDNEKHRAEMARIAGVYGRDRLARLRTLEQAPHAHKYWLNRREDEEQNRRIASTMASRDRRAREKQAEGTFTEDDVRHLFVSQDGECICKADLSQGFHVDHVHPLSKGGSNWPSNLQLLCPTCNLSKGAKTMGEWIAATLAPPAPPSARAPTIR